MQQKSAQAPCVCKTKFLLGWERVSEGTSKANLSHSGHPPTGSSIDCIAESLTALEISSAQVFDLDERLTRTGWPVELREVQELLLISTQWIHALRRLQKSLAVQPEIWLSGHLGRILRNCLKRANEPCSRLLLHALQHLNPQEDAFLVTDPLYLDQPLLDDTATHLALLEFRRLLKDQNERVITAQKIAHAINHYRSTDAHKESDLCSGPTRRFREWLLPTTLLNPASDQAQEEIDLRINDVAALITTNDQIWAVEFDKTEGTIFYFELIQNKIHLRMIGNTIQQKCN